MRRPAGWGRLRPMRRSPALLSLASLAVGVLAIACIFFTEAPRQAPRQPQQADAPAQRGFTDEESSPLFVTDGGDEEPPGLARPMPEKPFRGQKLPTNGSCNDKREVVLNEGCWRKLADKPTTEDGCGEDAYEKDGECWVWVRDKRKVPSTFNGVPAR